MSEPSKIPQAWADAGDYNVIPATTPGTGLSSWDVGFPVETQTPLAAGGVAPRRQDMNGALNWLSKELLWYQQGGLWQYDATTDYERGNVVIESDIVYIAVAANGPGSTVKAPSADSAGSYWKKLVNSDGTLNVPPVVNATTSQRGIVELATSAETKALTDSQRAITPSSLNGVLSLSPAALVVPKADSNAKLTGWLDAFKNNDGRVAISITGTAPKLQTARTIRTNLASTTAVNFDGSANVTPGVTGVLPISNGGTGSSTKPFVDLTTTQTITASKTIQGNNLGWQVTNGTHSMRFIIGSGGVTRGIYDNTLTKWLIYADSSDVYMQGLSDRAKKLNTARDINGTAFDGSADVTTAKWGTSRTATIKDATQAHTSAGVSVNGAANFSLLLPSTITAALNGNADSATKLKTARTINGTSFDGTANIIAMESSARSLSQNGYVKFQSGLIIQWGRANFSGERELEVTLPTAFTSAVFTVFALDVNSNNSLQIPHVIGWSSGRSTLSKLMFEIESYDVALFNWCAIGK